MIAASHLVAGAAVGVACRRVWVAVPVAFVSHFVLDQIPHSCFNMFSGVSGPVSMSLAAAKIAGVAVIVATVALAWRSPARWVALASGLAATLPDPLCYQAPLKDWFALLPGSWLIPWAHATFHCDVSRTHPALGFATQVVLIGAGLWVLPRTAPTHRQPAVQHHEQQIIDQSEIAP